MYKRFTIIMRNRFALSGWKLIAEQKGTAAILKETKQNSPFPAENQLQNICELDCWRIETTKAGGQARGQAGDQPELSMYCCSCRKHGMRSLFDCHAPISRAT